MWIRSAQLIALGFFFCCMAWPVYATRYLFVNIYGDALAISQALPSDVVIVPFGWTPAAESARNAVINSMGTSVSALPALLYQFNGKWTEQRVADQAKPWNWTSINSAIPPSAFTVAFLGDSIIGQMKFVQAQLPAPYTSAQNLGIGGYTIQDILSEVPSISAATNVVVLEGGINNFILGTPDPSTIVDGYRAVLQAIPSTMRVVVIGMFQIDDATHIAQRPQDNFTNSMVSPINTQIAALCRTFPNCRPAIDIMNKSTAGRTTDGIHFGSIEPYQYLLPSLMQYL